MNRRVRVDVLLEVAEDGTAVLVYRAPASGGAGDVELHRVPIDDIDAGDIL